MVGLGRPDAVRLTLPNPPATASEGDEVVLGIRPECIAEEQRRFGDDPRGSVTVEAPVEMIEPTGAETVVVLRLGGERVFGRLSPDVKPTIGESSRFSLDIRKLCLFEPKNGMLIQ